MTENIYNKITLIYTLILLVIIQLGSVFLVYTAYDTLYYTNVLIVLGIIGLIIYLIYKFTFDKKIRLKEIFILLLSITGFISFIFAYDRRVALLGFINRREGLFVILSYYIIFLLTSTISNKKYYKYIIGLLSFNVFAQVFYGFLQINEIDNLFGIAIKNSWKYAFGLVGNSNFFSSLTLMLVCIWLGIYIFGDNRKVLLKLLFLEVFMLGLIGAGAMSGFVGLVCILLLLIIYFIFLKFKKISIKKYLLRYILAILMFGASVLLMSLIGQSDYLSDIEELNNQATTALNEGVGDEFGTGRIYIWKKALHYAPDYLLTGIGTDQFYYVGIKEGKIIHDPVTGNIVDKAHNEYLQILLTEGIFKCIIYIVFLLWIFFKSVFKICKNNQNDSITMALLLAFTGYAIQAFFNISVVRVAPIFFILGGLLFSCINETNKKAIGEKYE